MSHVSGVALAKSDIEEERNMKETPLQMDCTDINLHCNFCKDQKYMEESTDYDGSTPYATPLLSPTASLQSYDSFVSAFSELSVDEYLSERDDMNEGVPDTGQEYTERSTLLVEGIDGSGTVTVEYAEDSSTDQSLPEKNTVHDLEITGTGDIQQGKEDIQDATDPFSSFDFEAGPDVWLPPQPQFLEDDIVDILTNQNDEEEYAGGTNWEKPSSPSGMGKEVSCSIRFEEHRLKEMAEVMNGEFKSYVARLLTSAGISSLLEPGESWVDIVTSLSWEAALLIKNAAIGVKIPDGEAFVKVKCIATGRRSQSHLVKGLVFKKNIAHKNMQTKYENPRLLLLEGVLGEEGKSGLLSFNSVLPSAPEESTSGLSTFNSMQENDLSPLRKIIEISHPNVVLVEKSVSRYVQEFLFGKGITLVIDMKLHRLERIARCTGSEIISFANSSLTMKLKQCDFFHFEKFSEEHKNIGEGGKRPIKSLMFLEGCPRHFCCTVLLKGSHSDELKKVKCVVHSAVVVAYQLILETSFLVDQSGMFSTIHSAVMDVFSKDEQLPVVSFGNTADKENIYAHHNGLEHGDNNQLDASHALPAPTILQGKLISSISTSLKKVIEDSLPIISSASHGSFSTWFGLKGSESHSQNISLPTSTSPEVQITSEAEAKDKPLDSVQSESKAIFLKDPLQLQRREISSENQAKKKKDDISKMLDAHSILLSTSSRNLKKGKICEPIRLCRFKFYSNFEMSLEQFLGDYLLNKTHRCAACNDSTESHVYQYMHQSGKLIIRVKWHSTNFCLPGEEERKIWMWSRCLKCAQSTRRVVMSTATRCLSLGKFLELFFSSHSTSIKLSSCGHSMHKDYIYFYGLGPMVTMFRYSLLKIYTVSMPPPVLEFNKQNGDWMKEEVKKVLERGILLFSEVENFLPKIKSLYCSSLSDQGLDHACPLKQLSEVEEMLIQERSDFEDHIQKYFDKERVGCTMHEMLNLNRLVRELVLESYIWDRRFRILQSDPKLINTIMMNKAITKDQVQMQKDDIAGERIEETRSTIHCGEENSGEEAVTCVANIRHVVSDHDIVGNDRKFEVHPKLNQICKVANEGSVKEFQDPVEHQKNAPVSSIAGADDTLIERLKADGGTLTEPSASTVGNDSIIGQGSGIGLSQRSASLPLLTSDPSNIASILCHELAMGEISKSMSKELFNFGDSEEWVWAPFSKTREAYMEDLQKNYSQRKFEPISRCSPEILSTAKHLVSEERSRLHVPVIPYAKVVSLFEDEPTSVIAGALAILHNRQHEKVAFDVSVASPHWPPTSSADSGISSGERVSSTKLFSSSSIDVSSIGDYLSPFEASHIEIHLGVGKLPGKGKYSVVCIYEKEFRALRKQCCPFELDYIASLSRCKNFDAKGGKSGSFFVKTMDDRFIVKQIKKIEYDSFFEFAPDYFKYVNHSLSSGSQSCLAKILGIYQVTIRHGKSGKDLKLDLMVMENVIFGRNITRMYDLKGTQYARYTPHADGKEVYLDENFVEDVSVSPLFMSQKTKQHLQRAIWNDTSFLTSINVMDYSLLVGVDNQKNELVCGIIDYLRQYTWDKQLESWVKLSLVVPKNVQPTVISPKEYKKRFKKFMSMYFICLP
ncbi:hypothetical protein MKW94_016970 [Papaver nudicaule]|uniref:1-phosphatidylinositol-3-phosphate 5-kinase n=1 Tax=Papaver nudicaule TaxID=74823 RepID=A0AA41SFG4_PAPNU|nr:hypothetical protein [Papaver nudicaule]